MIFIGIILLAFLIAALVATKVSKSSWTLKTVFGKLILVIVIAFLGFAAVFLGGANFPQLHVEVSSSIAIAKRELMTRV